MTDVSVIGLGAMGSVIAHRLLDSGYSVTVWNRTAEKSEPLAAAGATTAKTPEAAVCASPATILMIASYRESVELLSGIASSLRDKTIMDFAAGGVTDAIRFTKLVHGNGGSWLIGIINAYPDGVGNEGTVVSVASEMGVWDKWEPLVSKIGGDTKYVGADPAMIAALFAGLFTARQAFMFGMIYGGLVCKQAGFSLETYVAQLPVSLGMLPDYYRYFADSVSSGFESTQATMKSYGGALDDALGTFTALDARAELPRLFSDLTRNGIEAGLSDKALTALVELLAREQPQIRKS